MLRPDKAYTELEARVLDIALVLHMEHGGGNNSTFTTRVVTSSGSDTYSVMAAALSSLKGPKHGGANIKVVEMMDDMRNHVKDWGDRDEVKNYLEQLVDKQAFDRKGLIYGMGHAVYSLSDPRARVFKSFVERLAVAKGREKDFALYSMVENLAPEVIAEKRHIYKGVSANVDFYSGFVYSMLDIPLELYTPIFAIARIVGWSAHRMEELVNMDKIIRPAYRSIMPEKAYVPLEER
jgi:citrate synthase